jgi:hypothetical protein
VTDRDYLEREWPAFVTEKALKVAAEAHFDALFGPKERALIIKEEGEDPIALEPMIAALAAVLRLMDAANDKRRERLEAETTAAQNFDGRCPHHGLALKWTSQGLFFVCPYSHCHYRVTRTSFQVWNRLRREQTA